MSQLSSETPDTDALDWLQESMIKIGTRHYKLDYLESAKERFGVLVYDPKQKRPRFIRGLFLREAIERAIKVEEGVK